MFKTFRALVGGTLFLLAHAGAWAQIDVEAAEALMKKSGLWQQLAEIPAQMQASVKEVAATSEKKLSAAQLARLSQAADAAYAADRLQSTTRGLIAARLEQNHLPALNAWLDSGLGQKIRRLEEAAAADQRDTQAKLQEGVARLQRQDAARRALLTEFVEVTRSAEALTDFSIDALLATRQGLSSVTADETGPSLEDMRAALQAQRPQMLQTYAMVSTALYALHYSTLPDDELAQYLVFLKSEAGRRYTDVGVQALTDALVDSSLEFGRRLKGTQDRFRS
ncbi:MAG: hypothetical protein QM777_18675 [Pseudorhodoferax sp.]